MVIYTCILKKGMDRYECYEGFREFPDVPLEDYRNISVPSSERKFYFFKKLEEINLVKLFFPPEFQKTILYPDLISMDF